MELDNRIQQAKTQNARLFVLLGVGFTLIFLVAFTWIFLIKGYSLIIVPEEASSNYKVDITEGIAFHSDGALYVLGSSASLLVSADTFESVSVQISQASPTNIEIVLPPMPASVSAQVNLEGESSWYIDDNLVHVGQDFSYTLAHGEYALSIINPYRQPYHQTLTLARGEHLHIEPILETFEGSVTLETKQQDAYVVWQDQQFDLPFEQALAGGAYPVSIFAPGFQSIEDVIDITYKQPHQARNYELQAMQASLDITLNPSDGILLIDGKASQAGVNMLDSGRTIDIRYSKDGYFAYAGQLTLRPDEVRPLVIELARARGELMITSEPQAEVLLNGQRQGQTPLSLNLAAVSHKVELRRQGYRSISKEVLIEANKTLNLSLDLQTEFDARRAEGKPTVAQTLGIQMIGFQGEEFVMGSAPNQPGRRRNEYPVKVNLERAFYVSAHEITEAQFAQSLGRASQSQLPQTNVTWLQAAAFCNWLSEQEGLPVFYHLGPRGLLGVNRASRGYRLPTEAEWEWLAKKAKRPVATSYVWGNADKLPKEIGNFADSSRKGAQAVIISDYNDGQANVAKVGSYRADRLGLFDLAGNVSEWVHDRYTSSIPDTSTLHVDYLGPAIGDLNVTKGANYTSGRLRDLRAAYREPEADAKPTLGFRIARYAE